MQLTLFTTHKTCTGCGQTKPLTDYYSDRRKRDGRHAQCKTCFSQRAKVWYENNKERVRLNSKRWLDQNKERKRETSKRWSEQNQERKRQTDKRWSEQNQERKRQTNKRWRENNRERQRRNERQWAQNNHDKVLAAKHRRRYRETNSVPQRWRRSECLDHLCYWCGTTLTPDITHLDHIMPISLGGPHTADNTANTCNTCNWTKNNKHPLVWIAQLVTDN